MPERPFLGAVLASLLLVSAIAEAALPLWELQGRASNIRMLGSIHFLRADDYPLPEPIGGAYQQADIVVTEIDLDDLNPLQAQAVMQRLAVDPQGRNLEKLLGPADYAAAVAGIRALALDPRLVSAYEPWFAALQITQLHLAQLGFEPGYGVDARLVMLAVQDGKPVNGLETLEDQLGTLDRLTPAAQREFLMRTLDEADEVGDSIDGIVRAWRNGDVPGLERELLDGLREQAELYDRILVARNRAWTSRIESLAGDGKRYLVVVGALHLVGEDSVLRMLEARGIGNRQVR